MGTTFERASLPIVSSSAYEWNKEFFDGQRQRYGSENQAAVEESASSGTELIKAFLSASGNRNTLLGPGAYQILELEPLCTGCSMDVLERGLDPCVTQAMALLDDRCPRIDLSIRNQPRGGYRRPNLGPLSSSQLLRELRKKRYPDCADETNAARRLLYVTNPDRWVIMALASTASLNQTTFLPDFFYKYLGSKTALGIHRPSSGPLIFALEFHLQFYMWCEDGLQYQDSRKKRNGKPLRQSRRLNYLNLEDNNDIPVHIYETQVSCLITGVDEESWVAYQFVDTFYQGDGSFEQVEYYASQGGDQEQEIKPDPLTAGSFDANMPTWTPREYFLIVYECRLKQVRHAMRNLVERLLLRLEPYTQDLEDPTFSPVQEPTSSLAQKQRTQKVLNEANRFLPQTIHSINKVIEVWDGFSRSDLAYLSDILGSDSKKCPIPPFKVITMIEKHIDDLRALQRRAEEQQELCTGLSRKLEMQLSIEGNEVTAQQQANSRMMIVWTAIGLVFLPLTAVAAVFSMQAGILPSWFYKWWIFLICWLAVTGLVLMVTIKYGSLRIRISRRRQFDTQASIPRFRFQRGIFSQSVDSLVTEDNNMELGQIQTPGSII